VLPVLVLVTETALAHMLRADAKGCSGQGNRETSQSPVPLPRPPGTRQDQAADRVRSSGREPECPRARPSAASKRLDLANAAPAQHSA